MSYKLKPGQPLDAELRRVAIEQIDKASRSLSEPGEEPHEAIHDARKRFKKLRGLIRLTRPADDAFYRSRNAALRDGAKTLSGVRDKAALVEALDKLEARFAEEIATDAFAPVRAQLIETRDAAIAEEAGHLDETVEPALAALAETKSAFQGFALKAVRKADRRDGKILAAGLAKTYGRARKTLKRAIETREAEDLHEFRKRTKYHWMHLRLLSSVWPESFAPSIALAKQIADDLGDDHDYAVFRATLAADPAAYGGRDALSVVLALMDRRQAELRQASLDGARLLFVDREEAVERRLAALWRHAGARAALEPDMPIEGPEARRRTA